MIKYIEVNHSLLHRAKDNHQSILKNIDNQCSNCIDYAHERKAVPLKEYSNKFLRDNQFNLRQKQNEKASKNSRLNNLITKHKFFQKKLTGTISKNIYVCKTQPNQNEYKCFMTSNNFYKEHVRTHTQNVNPKPTNSNYFELENEEWKHAESETDLKAAKGKAESKMKSKVDVTFGAKIQEKISASRALEMYAKIISKDRSQLIEKIKFSNQKRQIKDNKLESRKNLEICQINLLEKQKKMSLIERVDMKEKVGSKSMLKFRKKTKSVDHRVLAKEDENFELKGWDN